MSRIGAGHKAWRTRIMKKARYKAWVKINANMFDPEKVKFLKLWKEKVGDELACVVCGDKRTKVLQRHHANPEKTIVVMVCANCHDLIRRGTVEDLIEAFKKGEYGKEK